LTNPTCWVYFFPADSFGRAGCSGLATQQPAGRLRERIISRWLPFSNRAVTRTALPMVATGRRTAGA
jgi:hypothetical protein